MSLAPTRILALLVSIGLATVLAVPAAAAASQEDTCALVGSDASDLSLPADPITEDGTCFGSLFHEPNDDMTDWYRRDVLPGDPAEQIDVFACTDEGSEPVVVQLYFVARTDPVAVPGPEDRVGIASAPSGGCSDFLKHDLDGLDAGTGGTWYVSLTSEPAASYALMTSVF